MGVDPSLANEVSHETLGKVMTASMLGLKQSPIDQYESVRVGPLLIQYPLAMQIELSQFDDVFGQRVRGVIGYELFSCCVAEIDLDPPKVALFDTERHEQLVVDRPSRNWQTLRMNWRLPLLEAQLEELTPGWYRLDIGASGIPVGNVIFHTPFVNKFDLINGRDTEPFAALPQNKLQVGEITRFKMGARVFENEPAAFATENIAPFNDPSTQSNIGADFLKHFRIVLDYQKRRFELVE